VATRLRDQHRSRPATSAYYRSIGAIRSPGGKSTLGTEYRYLGIARVERFAEVSTVLIENATEEILLGDRLIPAPREQIVNYVPHAPARDVEGRIIATLRDTVEMGRGSIVTIDKGCWTAWTSAPCSPCTAASSRSPIRARTPRRLSSTSWTTRAGT
jgi:hypothetical protein